MSREAMKLALEALEYIRNIDTEVASQIKYGNAAQIIEAALAEQPAQQEPVAKHYVDGGHLVYPTAQRPWVGLTHEDIVIILNNDYGGSRADCIRSAEAILKEKNT